MCLPVLPFEASQSREARKIPPGDIRRSADASLLIVGVLLNPSNFDFRLVIRPGGREDSLQGIFDFRQVRQNLEEQKILIRESSIFHRFVRTLRTRKSPSGDFLIRFLCYRNRFLVIGYRASKPDHFENIAFGKDDLEIALSAGHCVCFPC